MRRSPSILAPLLLALSLPVVLGGCGGASASTAAGAPSSDSERAADDREDVRWTAALLRKLDQPLRERVRDGAAGRLAVKVFFVEIPEDEELAELLLSRVGDQVVGEVAPSTLQRIASRDDVVRIEGLSGVGY